MTMKRATTSGKLENMEHSGLTEKKELGSNVTSKIAEEENNSSIRQVRSGKKRKFKEEWRKETQWLNVNIALV
jgi:hypothetical protein